MGRSQKDIKIEINGEIELLRGLHEEIKKGDPTSIEKRFWDFADFLLFECTLEIDQKEYSLFDIEFYYHSEGHPDPYVHKNERQKKYGYVYRHGSGFDLCFGDDSNGVYFGVLVKGMLKINEKMDKSTFIRSLEGKKIIENSVKLSCSPSNDRTKNTNRSLRSTRVGLKYHPADITTPPYIARKYRFVKDLNMMPVKEKPSDYLYEVEKIKFYYHLDTCMNIRNIGPSEHNGISKTRKLCEEYNKMLEYLGKDSVFNLGSKNKSCCNS